MPATDVWTLEVELTARDLLADLDPGWLRYEDELEAQQQNGDQR